MGVTAADGDLDLIGHLVVGVGEHRFLAVGGVHLVEGDVGALVRIHAQHRRDRNAEDVLDQVGQVRVDHVGEVEFARGVVEGAHHPGQARARRVGGQAELLGEVVLGDAVLAQAEVVRGPGQGIRIIEEEEVLILGVVGVEPVLAPDVGGRRGRHDSRQVGFHLQGGDQHLVGDRLILGVGLAEHALVGIGDGRFDLGRIELVELLIVQRRLDREPVGGLEQQGAAHHSPVGRVGVGLGHRLTAGHGDGGNAVVDPAAVMAIVGADPEAEPVLDDRAALGGSAFVVHPAPVGA